VDAGGAPASAATSHPYSAISAPAVLPAQSFSVINARRRSSAQSRRYLGARIEIRFLRCSQPSIIGCSGLGCLQKSQLGLSAQDFRIVMFHR
jgi:hypothetical protein